MTAGDHGDELALQLPPEAQVAYYKQRVQLAERELSDVQLWVEKGLASQADVHAAQWEARRREAENAELRKALSDAHMFLWEEREARLKVEARCDEIKLHEIESRRHVQHLLALAQPVAQEVTNYHGQVPDGFTRAPHVLAVARPGAAGANRRAGAKGNLTHSARRADERSVERLVVPTRAGMADAERTRDADEYGDDLSLRGSMMRGGKARPSTAPRGASTLAYAAPTRGVAGAQGGDSGGRILRTVYLPNERVESLLLTVESLRTQLRQHEQLAAERISAMLDDRRAREAQVHGESVALSQSHSTALAKLGETEAVLAQTMRDYLALRADAWQRQSRDADKIAVMHAELASAKSQVRELVDKASAQMRISDKAAAVRGGSWDDAYNVQLRSAEEASRLLVEKHGALQLAADARAAELEAQVGRLKEQLARLGARRRLDMEGFAAEMGVVRRELERLERLLGRRRPASSEPSAPERAAPRRVARGAQPRGAPGLLDGAEGADLLARIRARLEQLEANLARGHEPPL
ncbi:hypothetical protein KFE25_008185 [Diacronema lutheri]|uniref:Uncharacterized protein n=1 Tax=Diacronema lutheri TaxID=2081491 RepID=A0A8J6CD67_DIALT|nr:hypothetical protein KFE25_008185 [Diacronema lutheri]